MESPELKVRLYNVKKFTRVCLAKPIPAGRFGNTYPLRQGVWGDVVSNGFENNILTVKFTTPDVFTQIVKFDPTYAVEYLTMILHT